MHLDTFILGPVRRATTIKKNRPSGPLKEWPKGPLHLKRPGWRAITFKKGFFGLFFVKIYLTYLGIKIYLYFFMYQNISTIF
jgi:hypothetical protein